MIQTLFLSSRKRILEKIGSQCYQCFSVAVFSASINANVTAGLPQYSQNTILCTCSYRHHRGIAKGIKTATKTVKTNNNNLVLFLHFQCNLGKLP